VVNLVVIYHNLALNASGGRPVLDHVQVVKTSNKSLLYVPDAHTLSGTYEPPKEHATRFHHNPNYVTHFKR